MSKISYNADLLKIMSLFENITRCNLKDCFVDGNNLLTFIVKENEIGKAIGKKAVNVRKIESLLNKKIRIVEFSNEARQFVRNLTQPLMVEDVSLDGETVMIKASDTRTKGLLIGRDSQNLKNIESITQKYFPIKNIKVI
ncbi:MAG: NusA-like transcription termination signal-binding factor [archaeon]